MRRVSGFGTASSTSACSIQHASSSYRSVAQGSSPSAFASLTVLSRLTKREQLTRWSSRASTSLRRLDRDAAKSRGAFGGVASRSMRQLRLGH